MSRRRSPSSVAAASTWGNCSKWRDRLARILDRLRPAKNARNAAVQGTEAEDRRPERRIVKREMNHESWKGKVACLGSRTVEVARRSRPRRDVPDQGLPQTAGNVWTAGRPVEYDSPGRRH